MNLRNVVLTVAGAGLLAGCGLTDSGLIVQGAYDPDPDGKGECKFEANKQLSGGSVDVSVGQGFYLLLKLHSDMSSTELSNGNGETLITSQRNTAYIQRKSVTYTVSDKSIRLPVWRVGETGTLAPGGELALITSLIGGNSLKTLRDALIPGDEAKGRVDVTATVALEGELASGAPIAMRPFTYTFTAYTTGTTCPAGQIPSPNGPCGNPGQFAPAVCIDPASLTKP